jgi:hypothetical protein
MTEARANGPESRWIVDNPWLRDAFRYPHERKAANEETFASDVDAVVSNLGAVSDAELARARERVAQRLDTQRPWSAALGRALSFLLAEPRS